MNNLDGKLSPTERRLRVALGVRLGKSNCVIAKDLGSITSAAFVYWRCMSETRDKRRRTDLDLFVLALIVDGIATPYELQKAAGLSQGGTIPALQRLLEVGFVKQAKPGVRGRADHRVTREGKKFLKERSLALIDDGPSGDLDANLRVALLALWAGGNHKVAVDFLRKSADKRSESMIEVEEIRDSDLFSPLAYWYRKLRGAKAKALLKGESEAVLAIAEALPRNPRNRKQKKLGNSNRKAT